MRVKRPITLASVVVAASALLIAMVADFTPRIVWNATPSVPTGLYRIQMRAPGIGDFVLVEPQGVAASLIVERGYLPSGTPLIKRVSALAGDEICRRNAHVFINKKHAANALLTDSMDREMPQWGGCFTLKEDEIFLLNAHEKSLDGRYFGATKTSDVIGVAISVFVKK